MNSTISSKEVKNFTFAVVFYLIIGSIMAYKGVPGYVVGFGLATWTLAVFSFDFSKWKQTIGDSSRLILGLTPPYLIFGGTPHFTQIFKYYLISLLLSFGFWLSYKALTANKEEFRKALVDSLNEGGSDEERA